MIEVAEARETSARPGRLRDHAPLVGTCLALVVLVALLNPLYESRINPDATAYFSLASKWKQGDWSNAISGHWPPLLVWLIAFGLKLGLANITAVTVIDTAAGCVLLGAVSRLAGRKSLLSECMVLGVVALYSLYFTFSVITPDLLLAALLSGYLALASQEEPSTRRLCLTGAVAGLAYLAKPIALDFVLVHYLVVNLWNNGRRGRPSGGVARRIGIVSGVMFLVAAPWVACLTIKYHRFTVSTAGDSMFRQMAPAVRGTDILNIGLSPPPNATAFNSWEDPSRLNLPAWSPLQSAPDFRYFRDYVQANILRLVVSLELISLAAVPVLIYGGWCCWKGRGDWSIRSLLWASLILPPAYCLFVIDERYLLPVIPSLLALGVRLIPPGRRAVLAAGLLSLSFIPYPLAGLHEERRQGKEEQEIGRVLTGGLELQGNVASLSSWHRSLYICYFAGLPYYGMTAPESAEKTLRELERFQIRYLFVWHGRSGPEGLVTRMRQVHDPRLPGELQVYEMSPRTD